MIISFTNPDASWETLALSEPKVSNDFPRKEPMQSEVISGAVKDAIIREMEIKLTELTQQLEKKKLEMESVVEANHKFISIIAHDLRSPFNTILGYMELLKRNLRTYDIDKIENFMEYSYGAALKTYKLLDSLLEWASSKNGKIAFVPAKLNLYNIIAEEIEFMDFVAKKKNIEIQLRNSNYIYVFADQQMLKSIIRNLLNNAIKYSNEGGKIQISSDIKSNFVEVSVQDNGIGMSPEMIEKLFKISAIHTTSGTKNERGNGLGLLTCKEFIEIHGGTITVESKLNEGSVFKFTIPGCFD